MICILYIPVHIGISKWCVCARACVCVCEIVVTVYVYGEIASYFSFTIFGRKGNKNDGGWCIRYHPLFIVGFCSAVVTFLSQSVRCACVCVYECFFVPIKKQIRTVCWMIKRRRYRDDPAAGTSLHGE